MKKINKLIKVTSTAGLLGGVAVSSVVVAEEVKTFLGDGSDGLYAAVPDANWDVSKVENNSKNVTTQLVYDSLVEIKTNHDAKNPGSSLSFWIKENEKKTVMDVKYWGFQNQASSNHYWSNAYGTLRTNFSIQVDERNEDYEIVRSELFSVDVSLDFYINMIVSPSATLNHKDLDGNYYGVPTKITLPVLEEYYKEFVSTTTIGGKSKINESFFSQDLFVHYDDFISNEHKDSITRLFLKT